MTESHIVADDLEKSYGDVRALDGLSLGIAAGSVFALLGPNGAGKSTTVKILSTLSRPDAGRAVVAGFDVLREPEKVRGAIGLVGQKASSDPMATARENLELAGRIQGMPGVRERAGELLERFELPDRLAKTFSGGMARKLDVAIGLMHRPHVLFLDEPTTGLDRRPAPRCGRRSAASRTSPSCSPPTTWRRPTAWRTGSPSSTEDGSSWRARRTR